MKKILGLTFICVLIMGIGMGITAFAEEYLYSASVEGELSLHISPDENSYKITSIPACSKMELIDKEGTWGLVVFRKKCGWINLSFTRDTYSAAAQATGNDSVKNVKVVSQGRKINLYNVPSVHEALGSEVKYSVPNGFVLEITRETQSGWGLASMNGKYAWVQMKDTSVYETEGQQNPTQFAIYYVYVLSEGGKGLEMWDNAGGGNLCAVIPDCIKLTVREEKGDYAYVSYDGINGWIDLKHTTQSLANAQMNAGVAVNAEYKVELKNGETAISVMSVPSEKANDGGAVVGTVKNGSVVFVLRTTLNGWSLINNEGVPGWLPPDTLIPWENTQQSSIAVLDTPYDGYASANGKKGMPIYSDFNGKSEVASIPEGTKVRVIAHQNGYDYVYCDYAAGWTLSGNIVETYESIIEANKANKKTYYMTNQETQLKTIPIYSLLCKGEDIVTVNPDTYFEVVKVTTTGKRKWGLTKIGESWGWINLNHADKTASRLVRILTVIIIAAVVAVIIAAVVIIIAMIMKKRKEKKSQKEVPHKNENRKKLCNDDSRPQERTADVPGK